MTGLDRWWRTLAWIARALVLRLFAWRITVEGIEHVAGERGAVLAFNHHSLFDVVMVAWGPVIELERPVRFLAKAELFERWYTGWLVRAVGAVPVRRGPGGGRSRAAAYGAAVTALRTGELVAVAPEQTISDSFELLPFKQGPARMATEAGVSIVPAIGWGTQRAFPRTRRWRPHRHLPVVIRFGEPVRQRPGERPSELTARLRHRMAVLLDEVQRSYPDQPVPGDDWWQPARLGGSAPVHEHVVHLTLDRFDERNAVGDDGPVLASPPPDDEDGTATAGRAS